MTFWVGILDFEWDSSVQANGRCVSTYMEKYLVRTDAGAMPTPQQIAGALGIVRGSPYPVDNNATCHHVKIGPGPVMTRAPFLAFTVTVDWATNATKPEEEDDDPTTTRTIWSVSPEIQSRYVTKDKNDELIVNAAGQPYDGGIPVDVRLGSVTAKRNIDAAGYDMNHVLADSGKLNSEEFLGGAPGTVQVDISAEERYEGAFHYWQETYKFSYDPLGWQPKPVNAGFFQRASGDDSEPEYHELLRIINSDVGDTNSPDDPVQEPEPLDENGVLVPIASRPAACNFIEVEYFEEMDFADFELGTPGA